MDEQVRKGRGSTLVTGAEGFIGRALCVRLLADGVRVRGTIRGVESAGNLPAGVEAVRVRIASIGPDTDWSGALSGDIDTIVHLAARVHVMDDTAADPMEAYRIVNVEGTARLARHAAEVGVRRFVFISSIKVNGEESHVPYTEDFQPQPTDPYGISKWNAEQVLRRIEAETGIEVVVVRPTLVYGPEVKANFLKMMKTIQRGIPLPFSSIENKRSFIYIGNLIDALVVCAAHPLAAGNTYLLSDDEGISTPELVRRTATALGVSARLFSVPLSIMRLAGTLTGKAAAVNRLTGSLAVDNSKIRRELDWTPPYTLEEGLRITGEWFLRTYGNV